MHIGLVTHKLVRGDGQGRVNLEIAAAALRRGWQVTLIASAVSPELLGASGIRWIRIDVDGWPTQFIRNQVFALRSWRWLMRHGRELDVIHANGFITWARADFVAAHFVHAAWLTSPYHAPVRSPRSAYQWVFSAVGARLERLAYARAAKVIAVSEQVKRQLNDIGVSGARIEVIPNGVDIEEFRPAQPPAPAGGAEPPQSMITGLFIGDLQTRRKNLHTVLAALPLCPQVRLSVVGAIGQSPYPEQAARLGLAERVDFLGFRHDVPELMRGCDFVIFPSLYEPSGLVLFEAMASGVPVVTARTVGGVEMVHSECALLLDDPEDVGSMAAAINALAQSRELRRRMGAAGRAEALKLDFRTMAERYCTLFAHTPSEDATVSASG